MNLSPFDTTDSSPITNSWTKLVDQLRRLCGYRFPRLGSLVFAGILKSLPPVIESQLFPGIKATLDLRDETQRTTYWFGTRFEEPTPQVLRNWSVGATHFFDIGSNYGFYSFLLYSSMSHLQIYPFEPNPVSFRHLAKIQSQNGAVRVVPQQYGLADKCDRLQFVQLRGNTGHSSFATVSDWSNRRPMNLDASVIECEVIPFDQAVKRLSLHYPARPSWIAKIDVEGFEMKVLEGMVEALRNKAFKGICIELVEENLALAGTTIEQLDGLLRRNGYAPLTAHALGKHRPHLNHNAFYAPSEL